LKYLQHSKQELEPLFFIADGEWGKWHVMGRKKETSAGSSTTGSIKYILVVYENNLKLL
jgi:hypothetical protein